jgi:hypothetical protein
MPITPFLRGEVFDSEVLDAMSLAFTQVCTTLGLLDRDPITQHVAGRMVELAHQGIRTKVGFYLRTLDEFKANPQ